MIGITDMTPMDPDLDDSTQRRSIRVDLCVAVELRQQEEIGASTTVRVNRHGALLRAPQPLGVGEQLQVRNLVSGESSWFRVAWAGPADDDSRSYDLGIEMLEQRPRFWGARYEHLTRLAQAS
jgi:hypothetical protein